MPKQQTGLRIDRILYKQFQQLCQLERLRPGEAVESLMRAAVEAKSITRVHLEAPERENTVRMFDDALFKSRLARLKKSLEQEESYLKENGELPEEPESEYYIDELTQLGRRSVSKELVQEFEACLSKADKLHEDAEKSRMEGEVIQRTHRHG